jgi:SH3 domain protein
LKAVARTATASMFALAALSALAAETRWISDDLQVPLRSGPSGEHKIEQILPAGTRLELLGRGESGFVHIRTSRGSEGWLPEQYLVAQPIARDRVPVLEREIDNLKATIGQLRGQLANTSAESSATTADNAQLAQEVSDLENELAELRRISSDAVEEHANGQRLTALNERLRQELDDVVAENAVLQDNLQQRWLLIGAGTLLAGLLIGVLIKSRPRKSAWS